MVELTWERKPLPDLVRAEGGWVRKVERRRRSEFFEVACCANVGDPGRHALVPVFTRDGRKPRKLPALNSCCMAHRIRQVAWWEQVDEVLGRLGGKHVQRRRAEGRRDAQAIRRELAEVVPLPNVIELGDLYAIRAREQREFEARMAPLKAALLGQLDHPGVTVIDVIE